MSTGSRTRYNNNDKTSTRIHQAHMTFEAKFRDFKHLGSCTANLSVIDHVNISGIQWALTDKTKESLVTQCRHQAVRDAVAKASDYAAALDRPAPSVIEVRDMNSSSPMVYAAARHVQAFSGASDSAGDISFTPENVSMNCNIIVIFQDMVSGET